MNIDQSKGLRSLLQTNDEYAKHYAHFVQDVSTSTFAECRERYEGEFYSWKNRKAWATKHHVPWDTAIDSFKDFLLACGPKPAADYTLDRIDHKGPYLLANLRWADRKVQNNNKSDNVRIGVGDVSGCANPRIFAAESRPSAWLRAPWCRAHSHGSAYITRCCVKGSLRRTCVRP